MSTVTTNATAMAEIVDGSESESECESQFVVREYVEKRSVSMRKMAYILVVVVAFVIGVVAGIVFLESRTSSSSTNLTDHEQNAFNVMNGLRGQIGPLSKQDNDSVLHAFQVFDKDNDGSLNEVEFTAYLELQVENAGQFEAFDADADGIISYPEAVSYVKETNKIEAVREQSLDANLVDVIGEQFGFEYKNASNLATYLEYLVILMYFQQFDVDINGYIHREEYFNILAKNEFAAYDLDNDGKIEFNDFYDILYGDDSYSWGGHLHDVFGEDTEETLHALADIAVSMDTVKTTQIQLCPIQILRAHSASHRRLQTRACSTVCGWKCCPSEYYCEVRCS